MLAMNTVFEESKMNFLRSHREFKFNFYVNDLSISLSLFCSVSHLGCISFTIRWLFRADINDVRECEVDIVIFRQ